MSITPQAISQFDEEIIDTMYSCITKISDRLKNSYDPDSPESNSLFRLFCSAVRTNIQMVNKYLKAMPENNPIQNTMQKTQNQVNSNKTSFNNIPIQNKNSNNKGSFWRKKKTA
jgi:hypothetical protein